VNVFFKRWPKLFPVGVVLVAIIAVVQIVRQYVSATKRPEGEIWFYDVKTRELFAASDWSIPPIDTKSGLATGVRAYVYTCDGDPKSTNRFIAFLKKCSPELKQQIDEELKRTSGRTPIGFTLERNPDGVLVSSETAKEWFPESSDEGQKIIEAGMIKGGCAHPKICLP